MLEKGAARFARRAFFVGVVMSCHVMRHRKRSVADAGEACVRGARAARNQSSIAAIQFGTSFEK